MQSKFFKTSPLIKKTLQNLQFDRFLRWWCYLQWKKIVAFVKTPAPLKKPTLSCFLFSSAPRTRIITCMKKTLTYTHSSLSSKMAWQKPRKNKESCRNRLWHSSALGSEGDTNNTEVAEITPHARCWKEHFRAVTSGKAAAFEKRKWSRR